MCCGTDRAKDCCDISAAFPLGGWEYASPCHRATVPLRHRALYTTKGSTQQAAPHVPDLRQGGAGPFVVVPMRHRAVADFTTCEGYVRFTHLGTLIKTSVHGHTILPRHTPTTSLGL